jgi:hypothetical protein
MKQIILYSKMDPIPEGLINAVHTGAYGHEARVEYELDRVQKFITKKACDILICTEPNLEILEFHKQQIPNGVRILVTDQTMEFYSEKLDNKEELLVDHVIAYTPDGYLTRLEVVTTLKKLLTNEVFGIDKYLKGGTEIIVKEVTGPSAREQLNSEVMEYANNHRVGTYRSKLAFSISEELLMNATYDALAAANIHQYGNLREKPTTILNPEHRPQIQYACDGDILVIGVKDPFGLLKKEKFFQYLKKVLSRDDSTKIIDTKKGGAGLGLFKILFSSHSMVCNVEDNKLTEMMAIIDLSSKVKDFSRMTRSIHFFKKQPEISQ